MRSGLSQQERIYQIQRLVTLATDSQWILPVSASWPERQTLQADYIVRRDPIHSYSCVGMATTAAEPWQVLTVLTCDLRDSPAVAFFTDPTWPDGHKHMVKKLHGQKAFRQELGVNIWEHGCPDRSTETTTPNQSVMEWQEDTWGTSIFTAHSYLFTQNRWWTWNFTMLLHNVIYISKHAHQPIMPSGG